MSMRHRKCWVFDFAKVMSACLCNFFCRRQKKKKSFLSRSRKDFFFPVLDVVFRGLEHDSGSFARLSLCSPFTALISLGRARKQLESFLAVFCTLTTLRGRRRQSDSSRSEKKKNRERGELISNGEPQPLEKPTAWYPGFIPMRPRSI